MARERALLRIGFLGILLVGLVGGAPGTSAQQAELTVEGFSTAGPHAATVRTDRLSLLVYLTSEESGEEIRQGLRDFAAHAAHQ